MGRIRDVVQATTENIADSYTNSRVNRALGTVSSTVKDLHSTVSDTVILSLSKAWIGIGSVRPATTADNRADSSLPPFDNRSVTPRTFNRYDYKKLYSLQLGSYFMPLSQTFSLRAKKRLNVSSLVDGIDIIQQTRKEAKTIDCTLRIGLNPAQENLQILKENTGAIIGEGGSLNPVTQISNLAEFLREMYDSDIVFEVDNDMINNTFGITHVIMSEYKFMPRVSSGVFNFEFSLTEVLYGENVLTFNLRQIDEDAGLRRQITD